MAISAHPGRPVPVAVTQVRICVAPAANLHSEFTRGGKMLLNRFLAALTCFAAFTSGLVWADEIVGGEESATPAVSSLPGIPAVVHHNMQTRQFEAAVKSIDAELQKKVGPAAYLLYLKGIALTELHQFDKADATFAALESDYGTSRWASRARFGRAHIHVLNRDYLQAARIYRGEAERLLSRDRKDELVAIYLEFADRYFEGVPADDPSRAKQPDYTQALTYYSESVRLGPTKQLRQKIDFRIARCLEETQKHAEAIEAFGQFLDQYSGEAKSGHNATEDLVAEARYRKGSEQLAAGRREEARRTWQNLLAEEPAEDSTPKVREFRTKAQYRLAHTYGLPAPSSVGELELAVAFAEQFLKSNPDHELAPVAELEIAQGYQQHGRHEPAVSRLTGLIANPAYAGAEQIPVARRMLGSVYLAQQKFAEAIGAWKAFLEEHPTDSQWPAVQKQIVDAEYVRGEYARDTRKYDEARTLWQTFLNKYPLDSRASSILEQFGRMKFAQALHKHTERVRRAVENGQSPQTVKIDSATTKLFEEAIADWRRVVQKYPNTSEASNASMMIGVTLEDQLGRLKDALEAYQKVSGPRQDDARKRIAGLTTPQLEIVTERKFRSDEKPRIRLTTRNVKDVTVKVYNVDMADYFRKMHLATGVENLDIALIDPDAQFEHPVAKFEEYRRITGDIEIPVDGAGVTAVTVSSDKLEATTMVVVSDLDVIVKLSRNELFLFAENMRTGEAAAGVSVLVSDGAEVFAEELTGEDGTLQRSYGKLKSVSDLRVFAIHEGHVASTVNSLNGLDFAVGLSPKGYLYTDRPAYRAGQLVNLRGIVRWVDQDRFTFRAGEKFRLDIFDARGRIVRSEDVALNQYGTINQNLVLPQSSPQGRYRVCLHRSSRGNDDSVGALSFETHFNVTEYRLEPVQISVDLDREVFFRGEEIEATVALKYYYGSPLADEQIQYSFGPDGEQVTARTDREGKVKVSFETQRFSESQPLTLTVQYPQRNLTTSKTVYLATRGFDVSVSAVRDVFIAGETFDATIDVAGPSGDPVEVDLTLEVFEQTVSEGISGEKLVESHQVTADRETGKTHQTLQLDKGGFYIVRATGTDQFGNRISGQKRIRISGDKDSVRLRILAERHSWDVGEQAGIRVHWRGSSALALVTFEGASILGHQLVSLKKGNNVLSVPMDSKLAPNFQLSIAVMERNEFHTATSPFRVAQQLRVTLKPQRKELKPGENLSVDVTVTDSQGQPVQAELSLGLVRSNLLEMFGDVQGPIDAFFSRGSRSPSMRQTTSCTFRYEPETSGVSEFLLAEMERRSRLLGETIAIQDLDARTWAYREQDASVIANWGAVSGGRVDVNADFALPELENLSDELSVSGATQLDALAQQSGQMNGDDRVRFNKQLFFDSGIAGKKSNVVLGDLPAGNRPSISRRSIMRKGAAIQPISPAFGREARPYFGLTADQPGRDFSDLLSTRGWLDQNQFTVNGVTADGQFLALNGRDPQEILEMVRNDTLTILPGAAESETGFWDPMIVTDAKGKAQIAVTMPAKSTAWRLRAKGINGETLAGEASAEVITRKDLFGEMTLPAAFTVGDKAVIPVEVHSAVDQEEQQVLVQLKAAFGDTTTEQKKTIVLKGPGVSKAFFEIEIPQSDSGDFELTVVSGDHRDTARRAVLIRPFGFPVFATSSGTASQSTLTFVKFGDGLSPQNPALEIVIGPSVNRSLLDAVLGQDGISVLRCGIEPGSHTDRSVSDILGGVALLKMLGNSRDADSPDAQALSSRIVGAVSQLVASQREDGAWSWNGDPQKGSPSPYATARIMWALSEGRSSGFAVPAELTTKGVTFLKNAFSKSASNELELQTVILHSLAANKSGDFALANRLYRERNRLRQSGLVHLALALAHMSHPEMARDVLSLVRLPSDVTTVHQNTDRDQSIPWIHNSAELRALYFLALQKISPEHTEVPKLANWLLASRVGSRWPVEKVNGIAVSGLVQWHMRTKHLAEKYTLTVAVNGQEVETLEIDPARDPSRRIRIPAAALAKADQEQEVEFRLNGRGSFSYSAVLTGFVPADKMKSSTKELSVTRIWEPAQRMLDGKPVPRGFDVINGSYRSFTNPLTQLPVGERGEVTLRPRRNEDNGDYLILTETIPAGCAVLDGSVTGAFERYEIESGRIRFYIGNTRYPGDIRYTLVGYVPGNFSAPQTLLRSFYDPSRMAVADVRRLQVLRADEQSADEYRLTPDELYHFGERYLARGDIDQAHQHLTQLFDDWRLDNDKYKNVVQWLFRTSLEKTSHADVVRYFEIIKEKFADIEVSFENILKVAQSYQEMSEYERSYLVYRATIQGNFERESQVTGFLNKRGEFLRSTQILERLFADYPAESYVATATYALAQEVYRRAPLAKDDTRLKEQKINRVHLIKNAIHMLDHFLTAWPSDPAADQAGFALCTALLDLDQYDLAIKRSEQFAKRFAGSNLLDSFWYIIGYSHFELEHHDLALAMCGKVADATFPVAETGGTREAQNKWEAVYIMGQVYHSLGKAADAIAKYTQVKERFADAAEAINFFSRKDISMDEVVTITPADRKQVPLKFRNIAEVAVKVYRIDLMKFGLMQRNLDRITAINLAGIRPYHEALIPLGDGNDYRNREHSLKLPLKDEGAYLVVCRGDNLYASGLVLVSPLKLSVQEDEVSGRVRVTVKDSAQDSFVDDVEIKVIGAGNDEFISGDTDLRGLFVADDVKGTSTVIAMADHNRYAFFRGDRHLQGFRPAPEHPVQQLQEEASKAAPQQDKAYKGKEALRLNIINQNGMFQREQQSNYGDLLNNTRSGIQSFEVEP